MSGGERDCLSMRKPWSTPRSSGLLLATSEQCYQLRFLCSCFVFDSIKHSFAETSPAQSRAQTRVARSRRAAYFLPFLRSASIRLRFRVASMRPARIPGRCAFCAKHRDSGHRKPLSTCHRAMHNKPLLGNASFDEDLLYTTLSTKNKLLAKLAQLSVLMAYTGSVDANKWSRNLRYGALISQLSLV